MLILLEETIKFLFPLLLIILVGLCFFLECGAQIAELVLAGLIACVGLCRELLILLDQTDEFCFHCGGIQLLLGQGLSGGSILSNEFGQFYLFTSLVVFLALDTLGLFPFSYLRLFTLEDLLKRAGSLKPEQTLIVKIDPVFCFCSFLTKFRNLLGVPGAVGEGQVLDLGLDFPELGLLFVQLLDILPVLLEFLLLYGVGNDGV